MKAKVLFAIMTLNLCSFFWGSFHDNIFAFRVRAKLFHVTLRNFFIFLELLELFICLLVAHLLYEFIRNTLPATFLRTLNEIAFGTRFGNLKREKISVALFAERMTTVWILDEFRWIVILVTNFAMFWPSLGWLRLVLYVLLRSLRRIY